MSRAVVSFSGGETSAYMLWMLADATPRDQLSVVFCNTGQEHPRTLDFVREVGEWLDVEVVWLEAVVDPTRGRGTRHKVVDYETACRDIRLFAAMSAKYGLPGPSYPHCTRELKQRPFDSWIRAQPWSTDGYVVAIGIRADEMDRMAADAHQRRLVYPLVGAGVTRADVDQFWMGQPFRLGLPQHLGNCVWCWKKSLRKLVTVARDMPAALDEPERLERMYATAGAGHTGDPRRMFRGHRTVADIRALAHTDMASWNPGTREALPLPDEDVGGGCGESCEVWSDQVEDAVTLWGMTS